MINFSNLTFDNVGQWPKVVKATLIIFLSLIIIGIGYYIFILPNLEEYDRISEKQVELKHTFERNQQLDANLSEYRNQLHEIEERFGNMLKQLPTQNEMPALLEDISKTGIASGLTFKLFAPMPEVIHDFYIELPINIVVVGTYSQLAVFLSRVGAMSRIVTLHDFSIENVTTDNTTSNPGDKLEMKIVATIYRYRSS